MAKIGKRNTKSKRSELREGIVGTLYVVGVMLLVGISVIVLVGILSWITALKYLEIVPGQTFVVKGSGVCKSPDAILRADKPLGESTHNWSGTLIFHLPNGAKVTEIKPEIANFGSKVFIGYNAIHWLDNKGDENKYCYYHAYDVPNTIVVNNFIQAP